MKSHSLSIAFFAAALLGALSASAQSDAPIACECNVDDASNCGADQHCELWDDYCGFCADNGGEEGACECDDLGGCGGGYYCELTGDSCGFCQPYDSDLIACDCIVDSDCDDPGMICEPYEGLDGCGYCNMPANEPPECYEDSDCPPEMECQLDATGWGQCLPLVDPVPCQCFEDSDCIEGEVCDASLCACVVEDDDGDTCHACFADEDCPDGTACVPDEVGCNLCQFRDRAFPCECADDGECAASEQCDFSLGDGETCGLCTAAECECTGDLDCGDGAYCSDSVCGECIDKTANTGDGDGDGDDEELFINPEAPSCGCTGSAQPQGDLALLSLLVGAALVRRRMRAL